MERTQQIHEGRNIKRFREMLGMKQETLAYELGEDWTQKKISQLEAKEKVEEDILEQVAAILNINPEAIRNFDEEAVFNIINNTYHNTSSDSSTLIASSVNYQPTFNTTDKIVDLYERLLQAEKEKVAYLERIVNGKSD
ncbi:MAG TPA: helix-turn-helix transcriptional regulator [Parapedobacter sp.]|uniref:helix-turn-helix transcriptional regulator n=1 Tax=Parapedobacter sp. TaxID=1958893 RepID=UPI002CC7F1AD|nr:helix-turn-helix transcriptional regulator [Parapedobacter sp.]HWK55755.1 helix-turn-helix transcriptional regulator [Parapedobacter sp.]